MTSSHPVLKKTIFFLLVLQLAGLTPLFAPKAQALYWEDEFDGNDPKETKTRPSHFFLFDWVDDINRDSKKSEYKEMDNRDKGPATNSGARTLLIVTSGVVGLVGGLFIANGLTENEADTTSNMFIGGAIGMGAGIAIGALIMPKDYEVDQVARIDFMKYRQALLQDPVKLDVQKAFRQPDLTISLKF